MYGEFDTISKNEWLQKVDSDLKGKSIEALNWAFEDIELSPFYHSDDSDSSYLPVSRFNSTNSWFINHHISGSNPTDVNNEALCALRQGCNSLSFDISDQGTFDFKKNLKDINLEWIFTEFKLLGVDSLIFTERLLTYAEGRGFDLDKINGAIYEQKLIKDIDILEVRRGLFPNVRLVKIAASDEQTDLNELTSILIKTRNQLKRNPDKKAIAECLYFEINLSDSYLGNIAKIRSLRILTQNIFKAYDLEETNIFISAKADFGNSENDENYNIIRANAQATSAVIGGIDLLKIDSLSHSKGADFSNRISQNINHVLQLESHLNRVIDPSAGSYFLESLTNSICKSVWSNFQKR